MYYIKKYSNGWAVHNDSNGFSRLITAEEFQKLTTEFPQLTNEKTLTVFTDEIKSITVENTLFHSDNYDESTKPDIQ